MKITKVSKHDHQGVFTSAQDALDFLKEVPNKKKVSEVDYHRAIRFLEEKINEQSGVVFE